VTADAAGVTLLLAALAGPVPNAFVAATVTVYVFPLVKPVTTIGEVVPVFVKTTPLDESLATAMNEVIAPPPTSDGEENVTDT
jgi:hypothetical protein